jgi:hypothetical protein
MTSAVRPVQIDCSTDRGWQALSAVRDNARLAGKPFIVKIIPAIEPRRSIDQNALFQKWSREYACHFLNKQTVTEAEHEAMKYTLQRHCYAETGWPYLLGEKRDLFTGEVKPDRAHTSGFDKGEMHQFLNWVQNRAAQDGLLLESLGEYAQLQQEQVA